jgi:hypothetical protein
MKTTFRKPFIILGAIVMTFAFASCKKCKNEDPSARIVNDGTIKASVQIQTSNGNTVNINNIEPGTSSDYASYAPGNCKFTVSVGSANAIETVDMYQCYNYDIIIDASNNITTIAYDLND